MKPEWTARPGWRTGLSHGPWNLLPSCMELTGKGKKKKGRRGRSLLKLPGRLTLSPKSWVVVTDICKLCGIRLSDVHTSALLSTTPLYACVCLAMRIN